MYERHDLKMLLYKAWFVLMFGLWTSYHLPACQCTANVQNLTLHRYQTHEQDLLLQTPEHNQSSSSLEDALKEQGYYLKQLFHLYGENDTLTYQGLTLLLKNLGLGRVQVVQIQHPELGHDHVSHLDILDVQENKHRHVHSTWDHLSVPSTPIQAKNYRSDTVNSSSDRAPQEYTEHPSTMKPEHRKSTMHIGKEINVPRLHGQWPHGDILQQLLQLHHTDKGHQHEDCLNVTQLLLNFGLGWVSEITPQQFTLLCPALLYQIDSGVCIQHNDQLTPDQTQSQQSLLTVLAWGAVAVTAITAPSLLAVAFMPLLRRPLFRYLLRFLVALAVGTLCGDALLHLLPHAQEDQTEDKHHNGLHPMAPVFKGLCVLCGIYVLFLIENLLGLLRQRRQKKHPRTKKPIQDEGCTTVLWDLGLPVDGATRDLQRPLRLDKQMSTKAEFCEESGAADDSLQTNEGQVEVSGTSGYIVHSHHAHSGHSHSAAGGGIAEFVWMVLLGDGIHNFTDGLSIGAAFSAGFSSGLSTTVAVFCHELPHELGDFAVLLQTGVPVRRVLLFSLVSAFLSYLGMMVGAVASQSSAQVTPWIFSATAGIFLYVALVDMLPQMLHGDTSDLCEGVDCVLHSAGFLLGCGIMLCIALFQDQMVLNF
ncbi:zinc transporter ZIP5 isoform X2 [Pseudophryne corroboree]|uniref:zinc transporter ZIP5 isoform X2 n=1 Tax=Pseudophryne corroboree TaxID=495146 RepID=UPI0030820A7F